MTNFPMGVSSDIEIDQKKNGDFLTKKSLVSTNILSICNVRKV